ncbi:MAG: hypothetical protein ABJ251_20595 [Paracoccaceae bacterium]
MTRFLLPLFLALWGFDTRSQTWTYREADDGHYVYAGTGAGLDLDFNCNAPSTQGLEAIQVGAHEETPVSRGQIKIDIGIERLPVGNDIQRDDVMIWSGQTGYRLPTVVFNELHGIWEVSISAADALIAKLGTTEAFVLAAGEDAARQFPADGLANAISQSIKTCEVAWAAVESTGPNTASVSSPPKASPLFATAHADIMRICNGSYTAADGAFLQGQIDQDETDDFVVWWSNISCNSAFPRPLCGASHCSAKIYLPTVSTPMDLLAQTVSVQALTNGKVGLNLVGRFDSCGVNSLGCERLLYWNGTDLVEAR